jgi:DNA mismatch repair protein MutS2
VEFDPETLAPTFRLALGLPGRSNALAIAARLGLSAETITRARSFLSPQEAALDDLLRQLQRQREEAEAQRQAARAQRTETEQTQRELEQRLAAIEEERQAAVESARVEALSELEQVRLRLRGLANRLEPAPAEERAIAEAKEEVKALRGQIRRWRSRTVRSRPAAELDLRPGAVVLVRGLGVAGEILAPPNAEGEVELRVGALRARVPATQLEPATRRIAAPAPQPAALPAIPAVPLELHLRGMRADEVLPKLERYLDEAFRAGIPSVRIVHGKGTGTLRQIVRELLSAHPLVRSHHLAEPYAGGEGVTVAEMAL